MRKRIIALFAVGLVAAAFSVPASAGKKPVKMSFFLHGSLPAGEAEFGETWQNSNWLKMDSSKPSAGAPKSMNVTNYVGGPNTECSGNGLLPTWTGKVHGTVKGTVKVTLNTIASPAATMNVELYPDGTGGCNSDVGGTAEYMPPAAAQVVDVAPGPATTVVTFKNVNFRVVQSLVLQLSIPDAPNPSQVRVLYDSPEFASGIKLSVIK